jgi:GH24 family phage-related lysozyme (muramidase)
VDPSGNVAVKSLWDILFGGSDGDEPIEIKGYPIPSTPTPSPTSTPKPRPTQVPLSLPEGVEPYEQGILPSGGIAYVLEAIWTQLEKNNSYLFDGYLNQQVENAEENRDRNECASPNVEGILVTSTQGIEMIKEFELSVSYVKKHGLGEIDENGNLIGIYPYYVFKQNNQSEWVSDGVITFGYGHYVSYNKYLKNEDEKNLVDSYISNANFTPEYIPSDGVAYRVENAKLVPINVAEGILKEDLRVAENAVNTFLQKNGILLDQAQFDVLVSFTHQYGPNWWSIEPEKKLPIFIKEGDYSPDKVRDVFGLHDSKTRRAKELPV